MQVTMFRKSTNVIHRISFGCVVEGRELTAALIHVEEEGAQTFYHLFFSDGQTGAYAPGEKRLQDVYQRAVADDLAVFPALLDSTGSYHIRVKDEGAGTLFNVWVKPGDKPRKYHVFYRGCYQFSLRKRERWEVSTMREEGYAIDQALARLLCRDLDTRDP